MRAVTGVAKGIEGFEKLGRMGGDGPPGPRMPGPRMQLVGHTSHKQMAFA